MSNLTNFNLDGYSVRRLEPSYAEVLQQLYEKCTDYAYMTDGQPPSATAASDEFLCVPEGKTTEDKYMFGLFDARNVLLGLIESIRHYPDNQTWWLGLMMLDARARGQGLGSAFYKAFEHWVLIHDVRQISLSVIEANEQGLRFWKKMGFKIVRKTPPKQFVNKTHILYVMSRTLNVRAQE